MAARHSEFLLVDISNSFTKMALSTRDRIGGVVRIPTRDLSVTALRTAVHGEFGAVVLSSVVPAREDVVRAFAKQRPLIAVSSDIELGVGIDYPHPKTIGADRLANAASMVALHGSPGVVVDFGTAVTFDIISAERNYVGGVIAPGLEAMTDYLHDRTALLPHITISEPRSAIGKSTRGAMLAGAVLGYRGLVREILDGIRRELGAGRKLKVVATGGYAQLIASKLDAIDAVHPNLTLEGLRIIGGLNPA